MMHHYIYLLKRSYTRLIRLFEYLPIIWNTGDHDYGYNIELFKYQLDRTADALENSQYSSGKIDALKIRTVSDLIEKSYLGGYVEEAEEQFARQYGLHEVTFDKSDDEGFKLLRTWHSAKDAEHNQEINEYYTANTTAAYNKADDGKKLVWNYVSNNIENWWS
tara:strand:+ start:202 stop:690 length:489 start_codon:yes stop_codon:yes gene_type:complete